MIRFLTTFAIALTIFSARANALELYAERADTFICEVIPSGEFSASDFIAISSLKGERAMAYLPFHLRPDQIGISPAYSAITTASLNLYIKWLPSLPESNATTSKGSPSLPKIPSPQEALDIATDKIESAKTKKIKIEIRAIVDSETFDPFSENFRVSWDGKRDAPAPRHDPITPSMLESVGTIKLGEIEFDPSEYEDGDLLEFSSDELREFLEFAFGISHTRDNSIKFPSPLEKIERACIILKQIDGPAGTIFYSSDHMKKDVDAPQTGDLEREKRHKQTLDIILRSIKKNAPKSDIVKELVALLTKKVPQENISKLNEDEEETKDMRPRIIFEYRTDSPSEN